MGKNPTLVLIHGHPCTGKTNLSRVLSENLGLTFLSRDEFKELLFDELGIRDRDWSMRLGGASYALLFNCIEKILKTRQPLIVESNFDLQRHGPHLKDLISEYNYQVIEILLQAEHSKIIERFKQRWQSGERHRGHVDNEQFKDLEVREKNIFQAMDLGNNLIRFDTTNFPQNNWKEILERVSSLL